MTSVQSSVHLISLNDGPFIYLSTVLFRKGCIFRQEPEQWHFGRWVGHAWVMEHFSHNEYRMPLQKVPLLFLVPQLCQAWFLSPGAQKEPGRNSSPVYQGFPVPIHDQSNSCSSARATPALHRPLALHRKFLNLGHLPCPINFHKA